METTKDTGGVTKKSNIERLIREIAGMTRAINQGRPCDQCYGCVNQKVDAGCAKRSQKIMELKAWHETKWFRWNGYWHLDPPWLCRFMNKYMRFGHYI